MVGDENNRSDDAYAAFISYASANRETAFELADSLEQKGLRCWIAPRDLRPGAEYGEEIIRGINSSRCLVLLLSRESNESRHVRAEVERAASAGRPIYPVRIEDVLPSTKLEFFISMTQWIDAYPGRISTYVDRLCAAIEHADLEPASRPRRRRTSARTWFTVATAVVALLALYFVYSIILPFRQPSTVFDEAAVKEQIGIIRNALEEDPVVGEMVRQGSRARVEFRPSRGAGRPAYWSLELDVSSSLRKVMADSQMQYSLDGDEFLAGASDGWSTYRIRNAAGAKKVGIRFMQEGELAAGPFWFDIDFEAKAREAFKQRALSTDQWVSCRLGTCEPSGLGADTPGLKTVHYGGSRESLDRAIEVSVPAADLVQPFSVQNMRRYGLTEIPDADRFESLFVQIEFFDGSKSEIRSTATGTMLVDESRSGPGACSNLRLTLAGGEARKGIIGIKQLHTQMATMQGWTDEDVLQETADEFFKIARSACRVNYPFEACTKCITQEYAKEVVAGLP
jgi:hypothetical protein